MFSSTELQRRRKYRNRLNALAVERELQTDNQRRAIDADRKLWRNQSGRRQALVSDKRTAKVNERH
jgi:hypothetical protein